MAPRKTRNKKPPSRKGKVGTTVHFHPDDNRRLKQLALDKETKVTALIKEGINLMLFSYGEPPLRE